jgi:putative Holliday junction resolvase
MKKILGIDYGLRRTGVAIGWVEQKMALPRETIDIRQTPDLIGRLVTIINDEKPCALVVGMPLRPDGEPGQDQVVKQFIEKLKLKTTVPVYIQDEAWSSQDAKAKTNHLSRKQKKQKGRIDQVAAALFLQEFMEQENSF